MSNYFTLNDFLRQKEQFQLHHLTTEKSHLKTKDLSEVVNTNFTLAASILRDVDKEVFDVIRKKKNEIKALAKEIKNTLRNGGSIYLCGCGATGRLCLAIEWMVSHKVTGRNKSLDRKIIAFMSGGDAALIKSIESFEDHPDYAEKQMHELGFGEKDLLVGVTEGGETPFVIGAVKEASKVSKLKPWFLYCNPDHELEKIDRSKELINSPMINRLNLTVGPMAIMGSTRMQAASVQMIAIYLSLYPNDWNSLEELEKEYMSIDFSPMEILMESERQFIEKKKKIIYQTDVFGLTILTDTTERSPTFSYPPFENLNIKKQQYCPWYLQLLNGVSVGQSWKKILNRNPRGLDWDFCKDVTSSDAMMGYDFSSENIRKVIKDVGNVGYIKITSDDSKITWEMDANNFYIETKLSFEWQNILLKLLLNVYSTLLMGKMGRYQGNVMTYVRASNYKLVDRAIRYVQQILQDNGKNESYERVAQEVFAVIENINPSKAIVFEVIERLAKENKSKKP